MFFVLISIVSLFSGLALTNKLKESGNSPWVSCFEGFIELFISCIILLEILPHCFEDLHFWTIGIFGVGFLSIGLAEWFSHSRWQWLGWGGFAIGFTFHALVDGAALGLYEQVQGTELYFLALAVVFHRLPVGAILGMGMGKKTALILTSLISVATILGCFSIQITEPFWIIPLQAFAAGVLGHVVFDHSISTKPKIGYRLLGAIVAGLLFFGLDAEQGHGHENHGINLWTIFSLGIMLFLTLKPRPNSSNVSLNEVTSKVSSL